MEWDILEWDILNVDVVVDVFSRIWREIRREVKVKTFVGLNYILDELGFYIWEDLNFLNIIFLFKKLSSIFFLFFRIELTNLQI